MAAQIFKKIIPTKLASSQHIHSIRFLKYFENGAKTTYIASRELNSPRGVSKLENLALEAEKVVGYQTSLVRCLLSDEISSVLVHSKKLVGSRHPLLKTARSLLYDGAEGFEAVGLIVLLMSQCGEGLMTEGAPLGQQHVSGIQQKQRKLAEVSEMINTGITE
jgi:decaprenyl-diphosphate synthase subunit 2